MNGAGPVHQRMGVDIVEEMIEMDKALLTNTIDISFIDMIGLDIAAYKMMKISTEPPQRSKNKDEDRTAILTWARDETEKITTKERDLRKSIATERDRLKAEVLRLNAMEHDILYTSSEHSAYRRIAAVKKERLC